MADLSRDLLEEVKRLEEMFTVPKEKLKAITTHFVSELEKGRAL
jgi:hexokinase